MVSVSDDDVSPPIHIFPVQPQHKVEIPAANPLVSDMADEGVLLFLAPPGGLGSGDMGFRTSFVGLEGTLE